MTNLDFRRIQTLFRVCRFIEHYQVQGPPYGAVVKRLQVAAERLPALATEQKNAHSQWQEDSATVDLLRIELRRDYLIRYGRIGKDVFKNVAGAEAAFTVPDARATANTLVTFSEAMAEFIARDIEGFVKQDQPPDFLDGLRAVTAQLADLQHSIESCLNRQKAATVALAKEIPLSRKDIDILDGLLKTRQSKDSAFAAMWKHAKRVNRRIGKPRGGKWNWPTTKPRVK